MVNDTFLKLYTLSLEVLKIPKINSKFILLQIILILGYPDNHQLYYSDVKS